MAKKTVTVVKLGCFILLTFLKEGNVGFKYISIPSDFLSMTPNSQHQHLVETWIFKSTSQTVG